jgi:hypothetical protein
MAGISDMTAPAVDARPAVDELPQQAVEAAALLVEFQRGTGIVDAGRNLESVAYDAGIGQQARDVLLAVARDLAGRSRGRRGGSFRAS